MNKQAFTLIEMMTVIRIIGILTAVVLPQYRRAIQKAEASEAIAMLRVIHDSGERLAAEFGYKTFQDMAGSEDSSKATFKRMDMFDETTITCAVATNKLTCEHFEFYLNPTLPYISAKKLNSPYTGTEIRLYRADIPYMRCCKASEDSDACDLYNIDLDSCN